MFIVGIDVAKRNHEVTVITSEGQVVCKAFASPIPALDTTA